MSALLITGGAGFIGTNYVRHVVGKTDAEVVVLDALTYAGNLANLRELVEGRQITFVKGDICDADLVAEVFEKHAVEQVVHFAAESHVDRSILGPGAFLRTNVHGTFVLLEAARKAWGERDGTRFLHVSTDEVYGSLETDDPPFAEDSPYRPNSPYSASKAAADHLARAWHKTYGLPVVITNCSNNYGPWQFPEKLIPLVILNAHDGKELPVYGDGMQVRDWLHVEDHCVALHAVLEGGAPGRTYVIGGNCERPNLEIVQRICDVVDERLGRVPGTAQELIRHVTDRPGHDRRYALDAQWLRDELGWSPQHTLEEALPSVVDWYLDHLPWAGDIRSGAYMEYYRLQYEGR